MGEMSRRVESVYEGVILEVEFKLGSGEVRI